MKTITPVSIWANGIAEQASIINAYVVSDNLATQATFYFAMFSENSDKSLGAQLQNGNITMTGQDYVNYSTNQDAWNWIAKTLNITITGDYVAPII